MAKADQKKPSDKAGGGKKSKGPSLFPWFCLGFDLVLAGGMGYLYWQRPDDWAWLTCIPAWCWLFPALLLLFLGLAKKTWRLALAVLAAWLGFAGLCVEESRSLIRGWLTADHAETVWQEACGASRGVRVVSFNCNGGNLQSAREAAKLNPDVLLLQESPARLDLVALAKELFGDTAQVLAGADSSIIVRGRILSVTPAPASRDFVQARVRLARSGREVEVISLRFKPPMMPSIDAWTAKVRRDFTEDRRYRRTTVEALAERLRAVPPEIPVIIGGDFNVPAGEPCLNPLAPRLRDAFDEAGAGWGNTAIDPLFGHRIDQIWVSQQFKALRVTAGPSKNSDHRMAICNLAFKDDKNRQAVPIAEANVKNSVTSPKKPLN
jgi:endonuclease/exonuclease/phosphatase (EEP) superfamily protein YafD